MHYHKENMETLTCKRCGETKPISEFPLQKTDFAFIKSYVTHCKECNKLAAVNLLRKISSTYVKQLHTTARYLDNMPTH